MRDSKSESRIGSCLRHPSAGEVVTEISLELVQRYPVLTHGIAMPDRDGPGAHALAIDRDAKGRPGLVHAAVPAPDGTAIVVEDRESALERLVYLGCELRHALLLDQREHAGLDRRDRRME